MRWRFGFILVVIALAAACRPQSAAPAAQIMPTRALLPSNYRLEDAERIAREWLTQWQNGDLAAMHRLLSLAAQDAYPFENFQAAYDRANETMTFASVAVTDGTGIFREQDSVAIFNYNATFHTRLLGDISDTNRDLTLVVDENANEWRVAWTPDNIFDGMTNGAQLVANLTTPNRGNIYDRDGTILADQNGRMVRINVIRQEIRDYPNCLAALATAFDQDVTEVQARLEARPADWVVELGIVEPAVYTAARTQLEDLCAAQFGNMPARRYIEGTLVPHILGYVGYPDADAIPALEAAGFNQASIIGRAGIELSWDETLRGTPGGSLSIVMPNGTVLRELTRTNAQPARSLWLTIDADLQAATERIVSDSYRQAQGGWAETSSGASVVVMDADTGAIRALVSYPYFDNNAYNVFPTMGRAQALRLIEQNQNNPRHPEVNRAVQGLYPLGSVMKTVTATAAADSGVYALDQRYTCVGIWNRDITRYDWNDGHGTLTLAGALTNSCNPYFYEAGYQLDQADPWILPTYARRFGFGVPTGMTDLVEESGFIPDPDWMRESRGEVWTFSESVNMAIGQGFMQVTPLQVTRWFAAIANGGDLPTPYLVEQVGLLGDALTPTTIPTLTPINVRTEVMDTIRQGLCDVTRAGGTADFVFRNSPLQSIGVCGKTGTAQSGGPETPSHAWFASYAPRDNPEIVVVVMVETSGQGSEIAAPIARQVLEAYFGMN